MTEELKPCPFCGGEAEYDNNDVGYEWCYCIDCGAKSASFRMNSIHYKYAESWNKRTEAKK